MKTDITQLHRLTENHSKRQGALSAAVLALTDELETVKRRHMTAIKRLAADLADSESDLIVAVNSSRELFSDKKTMILNGVKIGLRNSNGRLVAIDDEATLKLIKKHFPALAETLIATTEKPKIAVIKASLDITEWAKIGCELQDAGEQIVVDSTDNDVEKAVQTMINKMVGSIMEAAELKEAA